MVSKHGKAALTNRKRNAERAAKRQTAAEA